MRGWISAYECLENMRDCHCVVNESKKRKSRRSMTPHHVPLRSSTCHREARETGL